MIYVHNRYEPIPYIKIVSHIEVSKSHIPQIFHPEMNLACLVVVSHIGSQYAGLGHSGCFVLHFGATPAKPNGGFYCSNAQSRPVYSGKQKIDCYGCNGF